MLLDKKNLLAGKTFPLLEPTEEDQQRALNKAIFWFWESMSHFVTAMNRGTLWTAFGSLNEMQTRALNIARLKNDFRHEARGYFGAEKSVPEEELAALEKNSRGAGTQISDDQGCPQPGSGLQADHA